MEVGRVVSAKVGEPGVLLGSGDAVLYDLSRGYPRRQSVASWIEGFEEGAPDGEDAALRDPEITEPLLYGKRADLTQVLVAHPGCARTYRPDTHGVGDEPLAVGHPTHQA